MAKGGFYNGESKEPYLYIICSRKDQQALEALKDILEAANIRFWYDDGMVAGNDWEEVVADRLIHASGCILLMTPDATASQTVRNELTLAVGKGIPVHTLVAGQVELSPAMRLQLGVNMLPMQGDYGEKLLRVLPPEVYTQTSKPEVPAAPAYPAPCAPPPGAYMSPAVCETAMPVAEEEKSMSFFDLLRNYSKENAEIYKRQKKEKKEKATAEQPAVSAPCPRPSEGAFVVPGAPRPAPVSAPQPVPCPVYSGESMEATFPSISDVQFSVVAEKKVTNGDYLMVDLYMYEEAYRHVVKEALTAAEDAKETRSGYHPVQDKSRVRVVLSSRDVPIEDGEEEQIWHGKYLHFTFAVEIPGDYARKQILLCAAVYVNDVITTQLRLVVSCISPASSRPVLTRQDILSAFVSYASQDRHTVAAIIQGMKKARPDLDIFFDIESLRSGEDWETALRTEIEKRDVLFLCWSRAASQSRWVDMEWRYALDNKGQDAIEPVPIDSPDVCPPPAELSSKHFNDKLLYIIKATGP